MPRSNVQLSPEALWDLAARQHGLVSRRQLLEIGLSVEAVAHRIARGHFHPVQRGIYAIGRPELSPHGRWLAAVMSCGPRAVLSHLSAAALWGIDESDPAAVDVTVPLDVRRRRPGVQVYRRSLPEDEITAASGVPVTTIDRTLLDLAQGVRRIRLEAMVNAADKHGLADPESLRARLDSYAGRRGVATLRHVLDRHTFALTDSHLERLFLPIADRAGLPVPETGRQLNGFKVDFYWPELSLVVETDGLRYHRTPAQQARDRLRDQAHVAAGLTPLRFTHAQIRYEPRYVQSTLARVARRLSTSRQTAR